MHRMFVGEGGGGGATGPSPGGFLELLRTTRHPGELNGEMRRIDREIERSKGDPVKVAQLQQRLRDLREAHTIAFRRIQEVERKRQKAAQFLQRTAR